MSDDVKNAVLVGLEQTLDKQRWFKPLRESVEGLTAAQAAWRPAAGRHSIWENVHHLTHYARLLNIRFDGRPIPENAREGEWNPGEDARSEEAWQAEVRMMLDEYEGLRRRLQALSGGAFVEPIPGGRSPAWFGLLGFHYHTAYHCGQIRLLRALQGI